MQSGFFGEISVEEAVQWTIEEAERLEDHVMQLAIAGETSRRNQQLDFVFKDLKANDATSENDYQYFELSQP